MDSRKKSFPSLVLLVLLIIAVSLAGYFYSQLAALKENPNAMAQQEVKNLVNEVSQLIVLPEDEEPTVATIKDVEKLKDQPFFSNAKNGFRVLIFTKAKRAILYDPELRKIVEVAPLNIGEPEKEIGEGL